MEGGELPVVFRFIVEDGGIVTYCDFIVYMYIFQNIRARLTAVDRI